MEPGLLLASVFGDSRSYNTPVGRDRAMRSLKLWAAGEGYNPSWANLVRSGSGLDGFDDPRDMVG